MTLVTIMLMALISFTTRYLFIHPKLPIRLGAKMVSFLSFSAPAVLTAIWLPIILIQDNQLALSVTNPYLIAATIALLVAAKTKSIYLTLFSSVAVFVALRLLMN
ncbi:AzlD domain-containing protein [Thalassotalea sp. G2M2-11]|uniref:AzlD domain-containing protein n=1 Tax=Thalassotalea sp. G2M2-11 TaxID=2787627 RepID=UPI0019D0A62D|nr:AzlD domain-containing protein [Thalassotalea sp. G2M2-11]